LIKRTVSINLAIYSDNIERSEEFYRRLGLNFIRLRQGDISEFFFAAELLGGVFELRSSTNVIPKTANTHIGLTVPSVDEAIIALNDLSAVVIKPMDSSRGRIATVTDPDGNKVDLIEFEPWSSRLTKPTG
jgi:predicted enzyme related to lactoylglutathione lyase